MITHPYTLDRSHLQNDKKAHEDADKLENHINQLLLAQKQPVQTYLFAHIAIDLGLSVETVREFGIGGGHNGFTAHRPDMTIEQALSAAANRS